MQLPCNYWFIMAPYKSPRHLLGVANRHLRAHYGVDTITSLSCQVSLYRSGGSWQFVPNRAANRAL